MRTTLLAASATGLLTAATLAGCASNAGGQAQTLAAPPTQTRATASSAPAPAADLSKALLALDDMPPGWSPQTVSSDSGASPSCVPLKDGAWKHLPQSAEADFEQGQTGPFLIEQLAGGSASQAGAAMRALIKATGECAKFTQKTGSGTNAWSLEPLSFPSYGDATYAFALTIASDAGMSAGGDVVIVRKGGVLVQVTVYGIGSVSVSTVEDLVGKAVAKA
jgi:hypothetical protein